MTSIVTRELTVASFTVTFFHAPVLNPLTNRAIPSRIAGISAGVGGVNSTLAYFRKVLNFGVPWRTRPSEKKKKIVKFTLTRTKRILCNRNANNFDGKTNGIFHKISIALDTVKVSCTHSGQDLDFL